MGTVALAVFALGAGPGFAGPLVNAQQQQQQQGQVQTSNAASNSSAGSLAASNSNNTGNQNINFNSPPVPTETTLNNVPNVYAPGLAAAGSEVCLGSLSGGGAAAGFGVTIGGTFVDRECQLRLNARTLAVLGYAKAARETMCLDYDVRQAMAAAGTPCAADAGYAAPVRYGEAAAPNQTAMANPSTPTNPIAAFFAALSGAHPVQEAAAAPSETAMADPPPSPTAMTKPSRTAMAKQAKSKGHVTTAAAQAQPVEDQAAQVQTAQVVSSNSPDPSAQANCHKEYQLIGGWYEQCYRD
jgi:hypothetical protein